MAVRLFHQNMLNWGGTARAVEFMDAFKKMRTDTDVKLSLGTDIVLAAGFTEITNPGTILTTHLHDMCDRLEPPLLGVSQFQNPILFAAGTDINGDLYEYVAILVNTSAVVNAVGYAFIYVNPNDGHDYTVKSFYYHDVNAVLNLPPSTVEINDVTYNLATNYRCVAFVYISYNNNDFVVGFMHNVCWAGEPGYVIEEMPAFMEATVSLFNDQYRLPMVVGGDFNTLPRNINSQDFANVTAYYATGLFDKAVNTTSGYCIDFWLANANYINQATQFSNANCKIHPQAYMTNAAGGGSRITDHKGISFAIL